MPPSITAVSIKDDQSTELTSRPTPAAGPGEVLIKCAFAGVNRADVLQRIGLYPPPPDASPTMGLEVSGTVAAIGEGVTGWREGDRVCALVHGGGYATHAIARVDHCLRPPTNLSLEEAAALPEALLTAWHNVVELGELKAGSIALIHGGASGIGTIAIQMAKALGATVISTAGNPEKCSKILELGADLAINYRDQDILQALNETGYGGKVNTVLDMAGGDYAQINIDACAPDGRIVCIGVMRGAMAEINLVSLFVKRLVLTGSTLRGMNAEAKAASFAALNPVLMPKVESGEIKPIIHAIYPLSDVMNAHNTMQSGTHTGKLLLDCSII